MSLLSAFRDPWSTSTTPTLQAMHRLLNRLRCRRA